MSTPTVAPEARRRSAPAPRASNSLGITDADFARLLGVSPSSFAVLKKAHLDNPHPDAPFPKKHRLWPGGMGLYDRAECIRWWRKWIEIQRHENGGTR